LVTVSYNSEPALERFWHEHRGRFPHDVEWIVVDNASTDTSAAAATALGARVVRLRRNIGFGGANNIGFEASRGSLVAFVNPDVRVVMADLPVLAAELDRSPGALVAPQLLNDDGSLQANGRGLPYLAHKVMNRTAPDRLVGTYLRFADADEVVDVEWLMGAVVAGTRERFEALGPWDERFFVYYEDSDLGLRNSRLGGTSKVVGTARWHHGWARETTGASASAWRREVPSMVKFYARYPRLLGAPTFSTRSGAS